MKNHWVRFEIQVNHGTDPWGKKKFSGHSSCLDTQTNTCSNENVFCAQNMATILGSMMNTIGKTYVII